jgi:hypothetical protein
MGWVARPVLVTRPGVTDKENSFMSIRRFGFLAAALFGLAALGSQAHATTISAGATNQPVTAGATPGTVVAGPTTVNMTYQSGAATFELKLTSTVYQDNTLVPNGLTFGWVLEVVSATPTGEGIQTLTLQDFSPAAALGSAVVEYDGAGVMPSSASWSGSGLSLSFNFDTPIGAGQSTPTLLFRTRAVQYTDGIALTQGGAQYTAPTFAPTNVIPEPTSLVLAFAGLPMLGLYLRRRARA